MTDPASPLQGASITVPPDAMTENVQFKISHADVTSATGLPDAATIVGRMITIETAGSDAWNETMAFDVPVTVTLPYVPPADPEQTTVGFYAVQPDGRLEAVGLEAQDETAHTLTFQTTSFASVAADPYAAAAGAPSSGRSSRAATTAEGAVALWAKYVQVFVENKLGKPGTVEPSGSLFVPSKNGWYINNKATYVNRGNCAGMTNFAKWYFDSGLSPQLVDANHDPRTRRRGSTTPPPSSWRRERSWRCRRRG